MNQPRLIQTYLIDGTLEGIRAIDPEGSVEAYVIPRLKLGEAKNIAELSQPALYILLNAEDNLAYIGESENFFNRAGQHLKNKDWWTLAVAIVSKTNDLEKGDVKYLESAAIERARGGSTRVENNTIPPRNNIHKYKVHKLNKILEDAQLILTSLGFDLFTSTEKETEQIWHCRAKLTNAMAVFRGDSFVILKGSKIDTSYAPSWGDNWPKALTERNEIFIASGVGTDRVVTLTENVSFKSPNHAGGFATGRSINAWTLWRNSDGQTMDEVMRRVDQHE
jgi:hypothetical protein